jgi:proline iminopeptidase
MFPSIDPYEQGMLDVSDSNQIYWECSGNPLGKPIVYLHGGPGSSSRPNSRRYFDPARYNIVLMDQRGCGRSIPHVKKREDLAVNTTSHLIADIEQLREHLRIDRWEVLGVSWGTTLALAYAQAVPHRIDALVLASVTTTSRREVEWITHGIGRVFPEQWERFAPKHTRSSSSTKTRPFARTLRANGAPGKTPTFLSRPATYQIRDTTTRNIDCYSPASLRTIGKTGRS